MNKALVFAIIAAIAVLGTAALSSPAHAISNGNHNGNTHQHNTINAGNGGGSNQGNGQTCVNGVCT